MEMTVTSRSGNYSILSGPGLLKDAGEIIRGRFSFTEIFVLSDDTVDALYGERVRDSLAKAGFTVCSAVFPHGEEQKNADTLLYVLNEMARQGVSRSGALLALGGGVTGDLGGLAAALYMRGIPCVQCPTTLLAMVDASVGGKTAVDTCYGKNLIGAFHAPCLVLQDEDVLNEMPEELLNQGAAEMIKCGVLASPSLFEKMRSGAWRKDASACVSECVRIKAEIVQRDETEQGDRKLLNLGHTFGHAIEKCSGYTVPHGDAVGMGMLMAFRAAGLDEKDILDALKTNGLPCEITCSADEILAACGTDKKRRGDIYTLVLPERIGSCRLVQTGAGSLPEVIRRGLGA
ncbi:MAG: 3-dehydroquinate synthase [Clostridiales bacterium]|nr:3-dehydroquinate synthase [Clostridiales bacterium]